MGFWQGLNEGLNYTLEKKARDKELAAARQERVDERTANLAQTQKQYETEIARRDFEYKQSRRDLTTDRATARTQDLEDAKAAGTAKLQASIAKIAYDNQTAKAESVDNVQQLKVLQALGASPENINTLARADGKTLAGAVKTLQEMRQAYSNAGKTWNATSVNTFLDTAVSTTIPGKVADLEMAIGIFGIAPDQVEEYGPRAVAALNVPERVEYSFPGSALPQDITEADTNAVITRATADLRDVLIAKEIAASKQTAELAAIELADGLTEVQKTERNALNKELEDIASAKISLDKGSAAEAIALGGSDALLVAFMNRPALMDKTFGAAWDATVDRVKFANQEELDNVAAGPNPRIRAGDLIILGGEVVRYGGPTR